MNTKFSKLFQPSLIWNSPVFHEPQVSAKKNLKSNKVEIILPEFHLSLPDKMTLCLDWHVTKPLCLAYPMEVAI